MALNATTYRDWAIKSGRYMNITWQQLSLVWTIIAVSAGGSFAVCVYVNDAKVSAYELRISQLERRV